MNFRIYGPYYSPQSMSGGGGGGNTGGNSGAGGGGGSALSEDAQDLADLEDDPPTPGRTVDDDGNDSEGDGDGDEEEGEEGEGDGEEGDDPDDQEDVENAEEEEGDEESADEKKRGKDEPLDESGRPTVKALKAVYPDIFKKFPYLKSAFFELPRYKEVFGDPTEAQVAANKANDFDALEATLVAKGDPDLLLKTLNNNNPKALAKVVENFGPKLRALDRDLYIKMTEPVIEELLHFANAHGEKTGNKNLVLAARHIANYVFQNGGEIPDIRRRQENRQPSDEETQLANERASFDTERFNTALKEVAESASGVLDSVIERKLDGLTGFEKKALIRDVREQVNSTLNADKAFQKQMQSLWAQAKRAGYSAESKKRVENAWLSRAKEVAPGIRNILRQEAMSARKGSRRGNSNSEEGKRTFLNRGGGSGRSNGGRVLDPHKIDYSKTSDADILSGDSSRVTFKK